MAKGIRIIGTGSYLPKRRVTNEEIEQLVRNFDAERAAMPFSQWVEKVTGIKTRYFVEDEDTEGMGAEAARRAIAASGISAKDIEFIIATSFTPAKDIPNLACSIGHFIGADTAGGFPLNVACAGFIYGLAMAYALARAEMYKNILVVSSETLSRITDYGDPTTAVLFADGAGAAVVQACDKGGISSSPYLSSGFTDHFELLNADGQDPKNIITHNGQEFIPRTSLHMPGGPKVLRRAVNGMADGLLNALQKSTYSLNDLNLIIPHQANRRITEGLIERLGVPEKKVLGIIDLMGNPSGASVAICLDKAARGEVDGIRLKRGDKVGLTAIGGGYSMGAIVFEY
ncbi:MAG: beta-ketoacyl-ACP synthase 3 [Candidatus Omnitrophota bacterium]